MATRRFFCATLAATFIGVSAAALVGAGAAQAKTCAAVSVSAKGEAARYLWIAKAKARSNWRSKVRRSAGLGAKYANWNAAENTEEQCATGPSSALCTFTGTPCTP